MHNAIYLYPGRLSSTTGASATFGPLGQSQYFGLVEELITELNSKICGGLCSVLPDPLIFFSVSRTSNGIDQGITSNAKHEQLVNSGEFNGKALSC